MGEEQRRLTWRRLRSVVCGRSRQARDAVKDGRGLSIGPYQPTPKPSPFVVSTPRREWRLWSMRSARFVEQLLEEDGGSRGG